jgi:hypothetical protein
MRVEFADQGRLALAGGSRLAECHDRIRLAEARLAEIGKETVALRSAATKDSEMIKLLREFDGVWDALKPREQARLIEPDGAERGQSESAGINRLGVGNERVLQ